MENGRIATHGSAADLASRADLVALYLGGNVAAD
jgi:ABC-type branched-subunit amino acid transport system ATPase component